MTDLLDANVFIQAKNLHYGFDFCPGFWDWIGVEHRSGLVLSVDHVRDELIAGSDVLSEWTKQQPSSFFVQPTADVLPAMRRVSEWATSAGYEPAAVSTFLGVADYLVAEALAHGHTVVTHEIPSPSTRRLKIPDACVGLGVPYVNTFGMLRAERVRSCSTGRTRRATQTRSGPSRTSRPLRSSSHGSTGLRG